MDLNNTLTIEDYFNMLGGNKSFWIRSHFNSTGGCDPALFGFWDDEG